MIQKRLTLLSDLWEEGVFFFIPPNTYDETAVKKQWKENTSDILEKVAILLANSNEQRPEALSMLIKEWANNNGVGLGKIMAPLRIALVGSLRGPDVFEICSVLGTSRCAERIRAAVQRI